MLFKGSYTPLKEEKQITVQTVILCVAVVILALVFIL